MPAPTHTHLRDLAPIHAEQGEGQRLRRAAQVERRARANLRNRRRPIALVNLMAIHRQRTRATSHQERGTEGEHGMHAVGMRRGVGPQARHMAEFAGAVAGLLAEVARAADLLVEVVTTRAYVDPAYQVRAKVT